MGAWLYAPPSSLKPDAKLPAVLIAPAGSDLLTGMNLSDDDRPEHLPYLDAGFVVLADELPGKDNTQTFAASNAGLDNGRAALEFLRAKVPFVDEGRIFTAGHSSAADAALLLAAHEPSLAGVAIYNSAGEGCWFQSDSQLKLYRREVKNLEQFCPRSFFPRRRITLYPRVVFANSLRALRLAGSTSRFKSAPKAITTSRWSVPAFQVQSTGC